jgi:nucleotide-binding universal stress UspA family protein
MPQRILAPLDGSSLAECVLPHIVAFTRVNGTEVTLVRVLENNNKAPAQLDPVHWQLSKAEAQTYLDEVANRLRTFDLLVETEVIEGPPADRIVEYVNKNDFDLVTLSTHGRSGLSGWTLGSVAQKVALRARKSIYLVPAYHVGDGERRRAAPGILRYQRILVPLDGSPRAEHVLGKAAALARYHEAELALAHVVTRPNLLQRMPLTDEDHDLIERVAARNRVEAERYFEQLQSRLSPKPQTYVLDGEHVPSTLQSFIRHNEVDLVLLSAHGHIHEDRRPYGNLAYNLMTYSGVPVIVFQDLEKDEIEQTLAELAVADREPNSQNRLNAPQPVLS